VGRRFHLGSPLPVEPKPSAPPATDLPSFVAATAAYEAWLGQQMQLVPDDLKLKHQKMQASAFMFLRATFYRWMQLWPVVCPELAGARTVLGVGDLHTENFGTWRDSEGRLIWGCNDFDEAYETPYALDLVRLAASGLLGAQEGVIAIAPEAVCACILAGYRKGLKSGPRPYVLGEKYDWLRILALEDLRDPSHFAAKMRALPKPGYRVDPKLKRALESQMPREAERFSFRHRVAGLGSLGRPRIVALASYYGSLVVREAKALAPSAIYWAAGCKGSTRLMYDEIIDAAERCPDPFTSLKGKWIVRRLAADASSIDIDRLPKGKEKKLLTAMGRETANVHLGSASKSILKDLDARPAGWLEQAAEAMVAATLTDWQAWKAACASAAPAKAKTAG
jgi:hypothetical protein